MLSGFVLSCSFCACCSAAGPLSSGVIESQERSWAQVVQTESISNQMLRTDATKAIQPETEREELPGDTLHEAGTSKRISPWCHNNGNFRSNLTILKTDLIFPKPSERFKILDSYTWLDEDDYTLVKLGWGYWLLGFFAGRFPSKDAVLKLTSIWMRRSRISYHSNGWIMFHFEMEEDMDFIQKVDRHDAAGVPFILCNLP